MGTIRCESMDIESLYKKHSQTIEELASHYQSSEFAYLTTDDIRQEVRIICANALKHFREGESSIKTYLSRCVANRLKNLKRDIYFRIENPCKQNKCPMYNVFSKRCTSETYPEFCEDYQTSLKKMQSQINVVTTAPMENIDCQYNGGVSHFDTETQDLSMRIRQEVVSYSGGRFGRFYDELILYGNDTLDKQVVDFIKQISLEFLHV